MMNRINVMLAAAVVSTAVCAMPTKQEIAKAEPLVQEIMKSELDALRLNKKTRAQVGAAALGFAKEAQAPAEKYLLLTGAYEQYLRGGAYDEALAALDELKRAIPDFPEKEELALLEKATRSVSSAKGEALRERHAKLGRRINNRARLEKLLEQSKANPNDKALRFRIATYRVYFDDWALALDAFVASDNAACAAAATAEKDASTPPEKVADLWWDSTPLKPDFLTSAVRAHAVDFYRKALSSNTLTGLQKVVVEKRIKEYESELAAAASQSSSTAKSSSNASSTIPLVGTAKYFGVELVGKAVKEDKGVLSGFANGSYGKIKAPFAPKDLQIEAVIEFTIGDAVDSTCGLLGGLGVRNGFTPFYVSGKQLVGFISTTGSSWNIASAMQLGVDLHPKRTYRIKCTWDGKAYAWFNWNSGWRPLKKIASNIPVFDGLELQLGTNRGSNSPFTGTIDLNRSYICIGGKLWWEGVKGAYKNANK